MTMQSIVRSAFIGVAVLAMSASVSASAPVEYVRICSLYGAGFYYIPGTDTCYNADTGETRRQTEFGLEVGQSEIVERIEALESPFCDGCFAVINRLGTIIKSLGVERAAKTSTGAYAVEFSRSASSCSYSGTIGRTDGDLRPGLIAVAKDQLGSIRVLVRTFAPSGSPADRGFHLSLQCTTPTAP